MLLISVYADAASEDSTAKKDTATNKSTIEGVLTDVSTEKKVYTLSLQDAISLAVKDNPQLSACDMKIESNKISLNASHLTQGEYRNATVYTQGDSFDLAYVKEGYYVSAFESAIKLGEIEKQRIENNIAYNVTEKYYNYKLAEKLIDISQNAYNLAVENKSIVEKSYELGLISGLEKESADVVVEQTELAKENNIRNFDLAKEDLKIALQLDGQDCSFDLTDNINFTEYESDVTTEINNAMNTRYDATALKENMTLAQLYFKITGRYMTANTASYNAAKSDMVQKEYNCTNNLKLIKLSIQKNYYSILSVKGDVNLADKSSTIEQKRYDIAKAKFDLGMITNTELTTELNDTYQCEVKLENAKLQYKLAVEKYKYEIKTGL